MLKAGFQVDTQKCKEIIDFNGSTENKEERIYSKE